MRFDPRSEEELADLLPVGEYDFQVKQAEDTISKNGSEMIKLTLCVWDQEGRERMVFDYLLEAMHYKIKHFADAVGIEEKYEAGGYEASDCLHRSGRCKIGKEEGKDGFQPKNTVKDYIKRDPNAQTASQPPVADLFDTNQDLPF